MSEGHRKRLIEKALNYGLDSFSKHEVLELYLFTVLPRVNTNPIAHELIKNFGSISNACNAPVGELTKIKGIGKRAAEQLKLLPLISRAYLLCEHNNKNQFESIEEIAQYCINLFIGRVNEAMYMLCLDSKNYLIKQILVAEGTPSMVFVEPRQIIENVTHTSTHSVVLSHNHPGGILMPSQNDIETTQRVKTALESIGVKLLDHIIVGKGNYISFNTRNTK